MRWAAWGLLVGGSLLFAACNDNALVNLPVDPEETNPPPTEPPPTEFPPIPCSGESFMASSPDAIASGALSATRATNKLFENQTPGQISSAAVSVDALLEAMLVPGTEVLSASLVGNAQQTAVFDGLGALTPTNGPSIGWISTGVAGAGTPDAVTAGAATTQGGTWITDDACESDHFDCVELTFSMVAPSTAHSIRFDFNFLSAESPEYVGSQFNDELIVSIESPTHTYGNIVHDNQNNPININSAYFLQDCADLIGTGFEIGYDFGYCDAGASGMLTTLAPVEPGETVTVTIRLFDRGDGAFDSAVMIDNMQFQSDIVDAPETIGDVNFACFDPTSGPPSGGNEVLIYGAGFEGVQQVLFGDVPALMFMELSDSLMMAVPPPQQSGITVDVSVSAVPFVGYENIGVAAAAYTYE